ncbi:MAG: dienelactone hydrolase family protein [Chloroflexi bacterium]|nr:dienelactone hydrolase family protein [Chloroflexota bacterium]
MADKKLRITVAEHGAITAMRSTPSRPGPWIFVYAPGAGSNIHDPFGAHAARALATRGITTVRFQFPYMEAGKKGPDRPPVLEAAWRAVIEAVRQPKKKLVVGGRSMGGRIASQVVAQGAAADALALFAYPLHPPGKPEQLRTEHLPKLKLPTLFVSGTNDAFGSPEELRAATKKVRGAKLHLLDGADHGFAVRRASGRTREDVYAEAVTALVDWLEALK